MTDHPGSSLDPSSLFHDPLAENPSNQKRTAVPLTANLSNNRRRRNSGARIGRKESLLAVELDLQRLGDRADPKILDRR
jgi:hypothetical protein